MLPIPGWTSAQPRGPRGRDKRPTRRDDFFISVALPAGGRSRRSQRRSGRKEVSTDVEDSFNNIAANDCDVMRNGGDRSNGNIDEQTVDQNRDANAGDVYYDDCLFGYYL